MAKLRIYEPIVKEVLNEYPQARVDDFFLYVAVLNYFCNTHEPLVDLFLNHTEKGIPGFESITRCRRKLQEKFPELRKPLPKIRVEETEDFIRYARDHE